MESERIQSAVFDLDGVITKTAKIHFKAWKQTFDEYMKKIEKRDSAPFREFTLEGDYNPYVDGKPRYEGVKSFLESRGINLPFGNPGDGPDEETVCGLGNRKNALFVEYINPDDIEVFISTVDYVKKLKGRGVKTGVASSSKNCVEILKCAGILKLFETVVDGKTSEELNLKGKPEPDIFLKAAENMSSEARRSLVFEDATSGIAAGKNGGFAAVVGVARKGDRDDLIAQGADVTVEDFDHFHAFDAEKFVRKVPNYLFDFWDAAPEKIETEEGTLEFEKGKIFPHPSFFKSASEIFSNGKKNVFFLDYDGTLTPIVSRPELAVMSGKMRGALAKLSGKCRVAVVSGRSREDVENLVQIPELIFSGNHGFDTRIPGETFVMDEMKPYAEKVEEMAENFSRKFSGMEGIIVEKKKFSVAVHYRLAKDADFPAVREEVKKAVESDPAFRLMNGKKVFEILPKIHWNKGKAVMHIMKTLGLSWDSHNIIYVGDDTTDEDAFSVIRARGTGILVSEKPKASFADFYVKSVEEVKTFFEKMK